LAKLSKSIEDLEENRRNYNEKVKLELVIEKNEVDLENLREKLKECRRILKDLDKNDEAIRRNNEINANINLLDASIKEETSIKSELERKIEGARAEIKANRKVISENKKIIEAIEEEEGLVRNWKVYLEMVGKNGISKMVLRNALPLINGELKRLLSDVCDFDVEIVIDSHNDVSFYIIHDGEVGGLGSGSGFEQTVASLALRSVLSKISTFSKPSFVVFDEILGGIADENYDQVKLLYDKIAKDYAFVLQITHLKAIADWHSTQIVIKKENNVSRIEVIK
jgi:DNA repair exonuclease SbcCD ATPase subunit